PAYVALLPVVVRRGVPRPGYPAVAVGDVAARRGRWVSAGQLSEQGPLGGPCLTPARDGDTAVQILFNLTEAAAGVTYSVLSTDLPTFFVDRFPNAKNDLSHVQQGRVGLPDQFDPLARADHAATFQVFGPAQGLIVLILL